MATTAITGSNIGGGGGNGSSSTAPTANADQVAIEGRGQVDPSKNIRLACPQPNASYTMIVTFTNDVVIGSFKPIKNPNNTKVVVETAHEQLMDAAGLRVDKDLFCAGAIDCRRDPQSQLPLYTAKWRSGTVNGRLLRVRDLASLQQRVAILNSFTLCRCWRKTFPVVVCIGAATTADGWKGSNKTLATASPPQG